MSGSLEVVKLLVSYGADPCALINNKRHTAPIDLARFCEKHKIVKYLEQFDAAEPEDSDE